MEIEITEYSQLSLWGYQYASLTVIGFMAAKNQPTSENLNDFLK